MHESLLPQFVLDVRDIERTSAWIIEMAFLRLWFSLNRERVAPTGDQPLLNL